MLYKYRYGRLDASRRGKKRPESYRDKNEDTYVPEWRGGWGKIACLTP